MDDMRFIVIRHFNHLTALVYNVQKYGYVGFYQQWLKTGKYLARI